MSLQRLFPPLAGLDLTEWADEQCSPAFGVRLPYLPNISTTKKDHGFEYSKHLNVLPTTISRAGLTEWAEGQCSPTSGSLHYSCHPDNYPPSVHVNAFILRKMGTFGTIGFFGNQGICWVFWNYPFRMDHPLFTSMHSSPGKGEF